ncbi:MAG: hypothetical protein NC935_03810 [Candidatus Omnitrophica bacterium]|nr:hypothetical protein [Candidatus Omnitrophota bacterium]
MQDKVNDYHKLRIFKKIKSLYSSNTFPYIIIYFGILLRLFQYLYNRSLWLDEAKLALNIVNCSLKELLLKPPTMLQVAPFGFLLIEKIIVFLLGNSEYTLRLFPLLSGILSLFLFHKLAKRFLGLKAIPIAVGLFAILPPLIYYSSELKQYSSDVMITLLIYLIIFYILGVEKLTLWETFLFGTIGSILIWFSHPAIFVITGLSAVLIFYHLKENKWLKIIKLSVAFLMWAISFVIFYYICQKNITEIGKKILLHYWAGGFAPILPLKLHQIKWYVITFFKVFEDPVGIFLRGIAASFFIVGSISMFKEKRKLFFLLISPIFFTLLASGLCKYPFKGRIILFIVPMVVFIIAEGAEKIITKTFNVYPPITYTFLCLLFIFPFLQSSYHLIRPYTKEEIKPVMEYLKKFKQNEDVLYIYYFTNFAFKYYSKKYGFDKMKYTVGVMSRQNLLKYIDDLNKLDGNKRVWVLFSHTFRNEKEFFLNYLDVIGKKLDSFKSVGASIYLYDLSNEI